MSKTLFIRRSTRGQPGRRAAAAIGADRGRADASAREEFTPGQINRGCPGNSRHTSGSRSSAPNEWKAAKAAGKIGEEMKRPQQLSARNNWLKAGG